VDNITVEFEHRGNDLDRAAAEAVRAIHASDVERLRQLVTEYPALLSWRSDDEPGLLGFATRAYGDAGDPQREGWFTRAACAELLIDAGAMVTPLICEDLLESRAKGLLQLFQRKGVLPRTLRFLAALGDVGAVRAALAESGNDLDILSEALILAGRFEHEEITSLLLERASALDPEFGARIDGSVGLHAFIKGFLGKTVDLSDAISAGPWKTFVMSKVIRAAHEGDVPTLVRESEREPWMHADAFVWLQRRLVEIATLNDRESFIVALLDLEPALLRRQPPPRSEAIEMAFTYAKLHLLPLLIRIWPVPDDLPHAAGMGNLSRVKDWFDESGTPALGDLDRHFPFSDMRARGRPHDLRWSPTPQRVLDVALAYSVINRHFDVADFLLEHGADINTNWNSHEPASILHHLVFLPNSYESMQFLIDRGIDMTIEDYRWKADAKGWARYGNGDEKMAQWLEDAERQRGTAR
jgi:hypothetical protein